ncbi:hypothetical protein [Streptomyces sp. NBC_00582]|uniref:hypothetical protein n=1 Tax=Streptomyces sp. NBC_00582 TaxID=2975783 RepID=UPI002E8211AA|nr:hypothetical protein [Streptomyces sp. NBC_00582]WUB64531.1 hypothetical protein OG852_31110 [Streptomyces sp. NBC_00582]
MSVDAEILYQKDILLVSDGAELLGHLTGIFSGGDYIVRIVWGERISRHAACNFFAALSEVRQDLEKEGLTPAVEGACRDVYPSRMALEMGGGRRAYRWPSTGRPRTVDIFDDVPIEERARLASVVEQREAQNQRMRHDDE